LYQSRPRGDHASCRTAGSARSEPRSFLSTRGRRVGSRLSAAQQM
jgi:hypothetical protein